MEIYGGLPGVSDVDVAVHGGDWPNIYPRSTMRGITYLFRHAWGDCPAWCAYSEYWYFIAEGSHPTYVGTWKPSSGQPKPDWWDEAQENFSQYYESWPSR